MPSKKSLKLLKHRLEFAEEKLHNLYLAGQGGEDFHPEYKKNKENFRKLVRTELSIEREMKKYFKALTTRVHNLIQWNKYNEDLLKKTANDNFKGSAKDWILSNWTSEGLELKVLLTKSLMDAIAAGGNSMEEKLKIDIGWNSSNDMAVDFLNKYSGKLAEALNSTTFDRVKSSLSLSLSLGENQQQAGARLEAVIDDPKRAAVIARTESVRAYTSGRIAVGVQVGATKKEWDATIEGCDICASLDGQVVGIEDAFSTGDFEPPAHPNCRCLINVLMPDEGETQSDELKEDPFSAFKNFFDNI